MFETLSATYYIGIYLLLAYGINQSKKALLLGCGLVAFEITVSIASFAKTDLLLILVFAFLAFISNGANIKKVFIGASFVLAAYFTFQPLVHYGRQQLAIRYGRISGAGLEERWRIVEAYLRGVDVTTSNEQSGLSRLSYVNIDAFVINQYDFRCAWQHAS